MKDDVPFSLTCREYFMQAQDRREEILKLIQQRRFVSFTEIADELKVSESTIRRDLELIEQQGSIKKTHGGVYFTGFITPEVPQFELFYRGQSEEKRAIAKKTVQNIQDGEAVLLDGGSTAYEVARLLVGRNLHIVTTSLPVANLFATDTNCNLVLIGGDVCPRSGVARGPLADRMLGDIRVRHAVMSIAGATEQGFFNNNMLLVGTERAMMQAADEVIIVADHTKWGSSSLTHLCRLNEVQKVISDAGLNDYWRKVVLDAGIELQVAD